MYIAIGKELGTHIVKMIGSLQVKPVLLDFRVVAPFYFFLKGIQFVERFILQFVAQPGGQVALFVGPRNGVGHVDRRHGLQFFAQFFGCGKLKSGMRKHAARQSTHKVENTGFFPLVFAESLVIHKQVHHLFRRVDLRKPAHKFFGGQRPFAPALLRKAESNVVAQLKIFQ